MFLFVAMLEVTTNLYLAVSFWLKVTMKATPMHRRCRRPGWEWRSDEQWIFIELELVPASSAVSSLDWHILTIGDRVDRTFDSLNLRSGRQCWISSMRPCWHWNSLEIDTIRNKSSIEQFIYMIDWSEFLDDYGKDSWAHCPVPLWRMHSLEHRF